MSETQIKGIVGNRRAKAMPWLYSVSLFVNFCATQRERWQRTRRSCERSETARGWSEQRDGRREATAGSPKIFVEKAKKA